MTDYVFTAEADEDLDGIVNYSRRQWGDTQARRYLGQLRLCLDQIADKRGRYRVETAFSRPLRVLRCQRHYIYCVPRDGLPALIVAILHEKMDLMARIAGRMGH
jgi:toxin ParE1/3/4